MPRVSVIIPTLNRAAMLPHAIESARQAGTEIEIVVVDDASTDATPWICRHIEGVNYLRLERNVGLARARNAGIRRSSGEYIAFLDDDDLRLPKSLDKQSEILSRDKRVDLVYGQVYLGDTVTCLPTGIVKPEHCMTGDIFWELVKGNFIYVPSVMVRRRRFAEIGLFAQDLPGTEDWDAWLRLAAISRVEAVNEPVAIYRDFSRGSGQMSSYLPRMAKSSARTQAKALRSPQALTLDDATRRRMRSDFLNGTWDNLIREGHIAVSEGDYYYGVLNYLTAIQIHPRKAVLSIISNLTHFLSKRQYS